MAQTTLYTTQQIANAAEVFVEALSALYPADLFDALFHRSTLRRAYWSALQAALEHYAGPDRTALTRALMHGHALAEPAVVNELLKLFIPGRTPDYQTVGAHWQRLLSLPPAEREALAAEAQVFFHTLAAELRQSPPLRLALAQLTRTQSPLPADSQDTLVSTAEQDLARLLDIALAGGPEMAGLQVRHLLALAGQNPARGDDTLTVTLTALARLAERLPAEALASLWAAVDALDDPATRARSLAHLAPHLERAGLIPDALGLVETALTTPASRLSAAEQADVLLALAPHLNASGAEASLPSLQQRALEAAQAIEDPASRVRLLGTLAEYLSADLQPVAVTLAFEAARHLSSDMARATALAELPPHLPTEFHGSLLSIARDLTTPEARALLLGQMLPHLPPALQSGALAEALAAIDAIAGDDARAAALIALAPGIETIGSLQHLPDVLQQAMQVLFSINDDTNRARAFAALAPVLSPELLGEALQVLKNIADSQERARALERLAPHLPTGLQVAAFGMARELIAPDARARTLSTIAPYLAAPVARATAYGEALEAALTVQPDEVRVGVLVELIPRLPAPLDEQAAQAALATTCAMSRDGARAQALVCLAPHLQPEQLEGVLDCALTVREPLERVSALSALLPFLPDALARRAGRDALELSAGLRAPHQRANALAAVAPVLPSALLEPAIGLARRIEAPFDRMHVLVALLPRQPEALRDEALHTARAVPNRMQRVAALLEVVPYLESTARPSVLDETLETALGIDDDYDRASALAQLAPHISPHGARNRCQEALSLALDACLEITSIVHSADRLATLAALAVHLLSPAQAYPLWRRAALVLRGLPEADVLAALAALAPLIAHLGATSVLDELVEALEVSVSGGYALSRMG
jgi:hypothetical protein